MKQFGGMWHLDDETAMIAWLKKHGETWDGRVIYQASKQRAVLEHCRDQRRVAVDVGAHIGMWSVNLVRYFEQVHAFEPVASHRGCWYHNMQHYLSGSHSASRATMHAMALGDHAGHVNISRNPGNSGDSWVKGKGEIEMRTLDSFEFDGCDLIKIDVEGYEPNVIRGAERTIARCRPVIICEQKRDFGAKFGFKRGAAVDLLCMLGYTVAQEIGGDFICVPQSQEHKA